MPKFKIEYRDTNTEEVETDYVSFEDWKGRATMNGVEFGPVLTITAEDWANDYGYTAADKGWYRVTEMPQTVDKLEVFFVGGTTGWAWAKYDADGNQMGEAEYFWYKRDALNAAHQALTKIHREAGSVEVPLLIYTRHGGLDRKEH